MTQEIDQMEETFLQAFRTSDLKVLEELMHDKLVYNNQAGMVLNKSMDVDGFKAANPKIETVECLERKIELFDDTAIVSTVIYLKASFYDQPVEGKTRFLRTWKKFAEGWKVIGAASININ